MFHIDKAGLGQPRAKWDPCGIQGMDEPDGTARMVGTGPGSCQMDPCGQIPTASAWPRESGRKTEVMEFR